jgi:outer membrane immunogenic protein
MKKNLLAGIAAAALYSAPALAAPPPAVFNWSGWYIGGNIGAGVQDAHSSYVGLSNPFAGGLFDTAVAVGALPSRMNQNDTGFVGGASIGFNAQNGNVVSGIVSDFTWMNLHDTSTITTSVVPNPTLTTSTETKTDWLTTLRGRAGILTSQQSLLYLTAGLALGEVKGTTSINPPSCGTNAFCSTGSKSSTRVGWTVGAGYEQSLSVGWTAMVEYLYYDLGHISYTATEISAGFPANAGNPNYTAHTNITGQLFRVGLNYRFGNP